MASAVGFAGRFSSLENQHLSVSGNSGWFLVESWAASLLESQNPELHRKPGLVVAWEEKSWIFHKGIDL